MRDHAQANRARDALAAQIDNAVKVACLRVVACIGLVEVPPPLAIDGHFLPVFGADRIDGRAARAFVNVDARLRSIDLLHRDPAHLLRLFPLEHENGRALLGKYLRALCVPFTHLRVVSPGADTNLGTRQQAAEAAAQQTHPLDLPVPLLGLLVETQPTSRVLDVPVQVNVYLRAFPPFLLRHLVHLVSRLGEHQQQRPGASARRNGHAVPGRQLTGLYRC